MATITTELIDTGAKHDGRGQRIMTVTERAALILAYRRSGLTQRAFAEREGIKYCTFTTWLQRRGNDKQPAHGEVATREKRPMPAEVFKNLPVAETIEIVPTEVQAAPQDYERIGEERTFEIDVISPKLVKRKIVRPKFRHKTDRTQPPVIIGHPDAGQRSAIIYSIVVSCQRHGKDPLAYMRDVLTRLPAMTTKVDLSPLTPANWQPVY